MGMGFQKNVGKRDQIIRILLGIVFMALALAFNSLFAIIGVILLATGFSGHCGVYYPLGVSTRSKEEK